MAIFTTAFAFVFPGKHFVGEEETITAVEIYDNDENSETIQIGKFISPGLPTPGTFAEEAALFYLAPPFNEGWVRFEVSATNATSNCRDYATGSGGVPCDVEGRDLDESRVDPNQDYVPPYIGVVFTTGAEHIGASPFSYSHDRYAPSDTEF